MNMGKRMREKGSALIIVLLVVMLLSLLGLPLLELIFASHTGVVANTENTKARYLAEMGAKKGYSVIMNELESFNLNPSWTEVNSFINKLNTIPEDNEIPDQTIPDEKYSYKIEITSNPQAPIDGSFDKDQIAKAADFKIQGQIKGIGSASNQQVTVNIPFEIKPIFSDFNYALFAYQYQSRGGNIETWGNIYVQAGNVHADQKISSRFLNLTVANRETQSVTSQTIVKNFYTPEQLDLLMRNKKDTAQHKNPLIGHTNLVLGVNLGQTASYILNVLDLILKILNNILSALSIHIPIPDYTNYQQVSPNGEWYVDGDLILIGNGNLNTTLYVNGNVYIIPLLEGNKNFGLLSLIPDLINHYNQSFNINASIVSSKSVYILGLPPISHLRFDMNSLIWAKGDVKVISINLLGAVNNVLLRPIIDYLLTPIIDLLNNIPILNFILDHLLLNDLLYGLLDLLGDILGTLTNFTYHLNGGIIANNIELDAIGSGKANERDGGGDITIAYDPQYKKNFAYVQPLEGLKMDTDKWSFQ